MVEKLIGCFLYLFGGVLFVALTLANLDLTAILAMSYQVNAVLRLASNSVHFAAGYFRFAVKEVTAKVLKMILAEFIKPKW